jgi:hypothetical protein
MDWLEHATYKGGLNENLKKHFTGQFSANRFSKILSFFSTIPVVLNAYPPVLQ